MKKYLVLLIILLSINNSAYPDTLKQSREIRAVTVDFDSWIQSPDCLDKLNDLIKKVADANFNTILLQVQSNGHVVWKSDKQPCIIDGDGNSIVKYVIENCRVHGIECHAWINPYELGQLSDIGNNTSHPYYSLSALCLKHGNLLYLDPGNPATTDYLIGLYKEMIELFDFDGVAIDKAGYPGIEFPDKESYRTYNPKAYPRDKWRRNNINAFISKFYEISTQIRPDIKNGAITAGTYLNVPGFSNSTSFNTYFQDAAYWMSNSYVDYIIPKMFYKDNDGFSADIETWITYSSGKNIIPGLAAFNIEAPETGWDKETICSMIDKVRQKQQTSGICFFNVKDVTETELFDIIKNNYFKYQASFDNIYDTASDKLNVTRSINSIIIESPELITGVELVSLCGQPIQKICLPIASESVMLDDIHNGIFILKIITANQNMIVKKIIR